GGQALERQQLLAMKVLSEQEATLWCQAHEVSLYLGMPDKSSAEFRFKIPVDAQARVLLVENAMKNFANEPLCLMWFDNWGVWSGQRLHVFDRFRTSYGETRPLIESPGHLFNQTEIEDATSFATIAVLFLWDCYVLVPRLRKLLYFSHDEFGLSKGFELPDSVKVPSVPPGTVRPHVLPIWWTDYREPLAGDPIGCPVS